MVDITHYLELETQTCVCQLTRIESYRGIQPISLDLGVAASAAAAASWPPSFFSTGMVTLAKKPETCRIHRNTMYI